MARQRLGPKKIRRIEVILGKEVDVALVRGGTTHFLACVKCKDGSKYWVNYKTGEVKPNDYADPLTNTVKQFLGGVS